MFLLFLYRHIALIGSFGRHIEESAFRLFLLRKLDTYKSNIGVSCKDALLVCIRKSMRDTAKLSRNSTYLYYKESNLTQRMRR